MMGDFNFQCICCNTTIDVNQNQVGYVVYCPKCMAELIVPDFTGDEPGDVMDDSLVDMADEQQATGDYGAAGGDEQGHVDNDEGDAQSGRPSSTTISQVIYRDANGQPIIPEDVAQALSDNPEALDSMTDTKLALAETLKALQANQQALAEARQELAARRQTSDTDHVKISDTSNQLVHDDYVVDTSQYNQSPPEPEIIEQGLSNELSDGTAVFTPRGEDTEELDHPPIDVPLEEEYHGPVEYEPLYTPHGDFLPFTDEDFAHALEHESAALFDGISQIRPTPQCWSYSVFALILESHITQVLPEVLPVVPLTGVFFGGTQKYLDEMNKQYVVFSNIMRRMVKPLGAEFQHALMQHDIYAYTDVVQELDQPMQELAQFMVNFQHIALPKKEPFLSLRTIMLQYYDAVRKNLMDIVDRLDYRSEYTPEQAKMGTISVSLMPCTVHKFGLLMNHFTMK